MGEVYFVSREQTTDVERLSGWYAFDPVSGDATGPFDTHGGAAQYLAEREAEVRDDA